MTIFCVATSVLVVAYFWRHILRAHFSKRSQPVNFIAKVQNDICTMRIVQRCLCLSEAKLISNPLFFNEIKFHSEL